MAAPLRFILLASRKFTARHAGRLIPPTKGQAEFRNMEDEMTFLLCGLIHAAIDCFMEHYPPIKALTLANVLYRIEHQARCLGNYYERASKSNLENPRLDEKLREEC